jgi:hypothetical protein
MQVDIYLQVFCKVMREKFLFSNHIDIFLVVGLGFELWAMHLLGKCSTSWAMTSVLSLVFFLKVESHIFAWDWPQIKILPLMFPMQLGWQVCTSMPGLFVEITFCSEWTRTIILLISSSWVAGIYRHVSWCLAWHILNLISYTIPTVSLIKIKDKNDGFVLICILQGHHLRLP